MTQKISTNELDNSWYPLLGGASAPSTPATGSALLYGIGTTTVRPAFMNSGGVAERLITEGGTGTLLLGQTQTTSNFTTTTAGSYVDVTSMSVTVTVPAGGRSIKISTSNGRRLASSQASGNIYVAIYEGATKLTEKVQQQASANFNVVVDPWIIITPSAGSHTYKISIMQDNAGTLTYDAAATYPAIIAVELL